MHDCPPSADWQSLTELVSAFSKMPETTDVGTSPISSNSTSAKNCTSRLPLKQHSVLDKVRSTACGIHHHATLPAVFGLAPPDRIFLGLLKTTCSGSVQDTAARLQLGDIWTGERGTLVVIGQKHLAVVTSGLHASRQRDPARLFLGCYGLSYTDGETCIPRWLLILCNRTPSSDPMTSRLCRPLPRRSWNGSATANPLITNRILARRTAPFCERRTDVQAGQKKKRQTETLWKIA